MFSTHSKFKLIGSLPILAANAQASAQPDNSSPPKIEAINVKPNIPAQPPEPKIPTIHSVSPYEKMNVADDTLEVVARLQRSAKEVRAMDVWSLDPEIFPDQEKTKKSKPYPFNEFHSLGRKGLKGQEAIQALLFAVTLSVAKASTEETPDCFEPRHGLRIYEQQGFIDVLLCYSCSKGILYDGERVLYFYTAQEAEADFDKAFERLGLAKAN